MRYSVVAHSDSFTVRKHGTGDILTFEFRSYLEHITARDDAYRVRDELERAYEQGYQSRLAVGAERAINAESWSQTYAGCANDVKVGPNRDGEYQHMINGVLCPERFANAASARYAARQHLRGESES